MQDDKIKMSEVKQDKKMALHYMETLIDVARESFLILDSNLRVIEANPIFYQTFLVSKKDTVDKLVFDLGNGQWNIPELKKLIEEILPDKKVVRDFEVSHKFESIGVKTMQLNASQIDSVQLIIIAIEDISVRKGLEEELAKYTKGLEGQIVDRTTELTSKNIELEKLNRFMVGREVKMSEQKKEIADLKKSQ